MRIALGWCLTFKRMTLRCIAQDMETLVCRQTLSGHKDDVLSISGLLPPPPAFPRETTKSHNAPNGHAKANEIFREVSAAPTSQTSVDLLLHVLSFQLQSGIC